MNTCTVFSEKDDLSAIPELLKKELHPISLEKEETGEDWTVLSFSRRKLLRKRQLEVKAVRAGQTLQDMKDRLLHVYRGIPTEAEGVRELLTQRIAGFQSAVVLEVDRGDLIGFEDVVFFLAKTMDGLIFWEGKQMLDPKGKIVMDFSGVSRVSALPEWMPATTEAKSWAAEAMDRKAASEAWLKDLGVPFNPELPPLSETTSDSQVRSSEAVLDRALALALVALKGSQAPEEILRELEDRYKARQWMTGAEVAFYGSENPTDEELAEHAWRFEALWTLLWALGFVSALQYPSQPCDVPAAVGLLRKVEDRAGLLRRVRMRSVAEVLDEADRHHRLHWLVKDAAMRRQPAPADLVPGIVLERQRSLDWLRRPEMSWQDGR